MKFASLSSPTLKMWPRSRTSALSAFLTVAILQASVLATVVDPSVLDACPGYTATNIKTKPNGLSADLVLGSKACNVFGEDVKKLSLNVVYETSTFASLSP